MRIVNKIISFIIIAILMSVASCSPDATNPMDPKYGEGGENGEENEENIPTATLGVDVSDRMSINPKIFGVNNDWRQIPDTRFADFNTGLEAIGATMLRYPGGWESEFYDWDNNATPGWDNTPEEPGVSVESMKSYIETYSIVLPTAIAMNESLNSSAFNDALQELKETAEKAINIVGANDVEVVEIGNEWWLQWGGGVSRADKLSKYTVIAMNIAEYIGETFPDKQFKLVVNGDYTKPEEFTAMKNQFTKAYDLLDGVALHTYTGYQTDTHHIDDLESRIKTSSNNFNSEKNFIYLSEWMPSRDYNERRLYMQAANIIPDIFQIYARAGADAAAFWPPVNTSIPGLGLLNWNFSTTFPVGQIFGELSESFRGDVVKTTNASFHITAALNDAETLVLFITGEDEPATKTTVNIENFSVNSVESVERYVPADYSETDKAAPYETETASVTLISDNEIVFNINEEGMYQIYKIVLKGTVQ